jgi:serine phosphatase RsbU (regulator of sigma subunit)/anti-sigma regulatory factor (Ser/Thr protein kinase)
LLKTIQFKYFIFSLLLIYTHFLPAQNTVVIDRSFDYTGIGNKIEILEDPGGLYKLKDILSPDISEKFKPSEEDEPNFGFTSSVYWVRFILENSDSLNITTYLEVSYPLIDNIDLYIPDNKGSWRVKSSGDHHPFNSRDIRHRNFIFIIEQEPGIQTLYMRFQTSSSLNLPLTLWSQQALLNKTGTEQILLGIFFGAVIIMIIYNIFLYIGLKDKSFIYLFLFIMSWGLAQFTIDGLSFQYLWSGLTWWADVNLPVFIFISLAAAVQFCRSLLKTNQNFPVWDKILKTERNIFIAGVLLSLLINYALSIKLAAGMAIPAILSVGLTGLAGIQQKDRSAAIFLTAWGLFLTGAILFALKSFGLLPSNYMTSFSIQFGFFAMMILLSVAVQDRVVTEKKEKEKAQEQLIEALKQSEQVLEKKAEERTQEINRINIMLMDRAIELDGINKLTEKVNSSLRLPEVLLFACEEFVKIFPVKYSAIYLLNDSKKKYEIASFYSTEEGTGLNLTREFPINTDEVIRAVTETRLPGSFGQMPAILDNREEGSVLIVPVVLLKKTIGMVVLPSADPLHEFSRDESDLAKTMAVQVAGAVQNAKQYSETESALDVAERDLEIGRQIQSGFFPVSIPQTQDWEIAAYFKGARQVAGDFYDVFPLDGNRLTALIIADVCDKGVGAALFMVVFRSLLRAYSENTIRSSNISEGLQKVLTDTNNYIANTHNASNMFASIFFGIINTEASEVYYINAGHDAPLLINKEGKIIQRLMPTGPAAGMFPDLEFGVECLHLDKGDILLTFTDGSSDARDESNNLFTEEVLSGIAAAPHSSAYSLLYDINSALKKHIGSSSQFDDITQLCIRRKSSADDNIHLIERVAVPENLEELRNFIEGAAIHQQIEENVVHALKLAAEEICSNIINYGFNGSIGYIRVSLERSGDNAVLKISDNGLHFPPDKAETADISLEPEKRRIGGLGIHLVKELMDEISYTRDGDSNLLILEKKLKPQETKQWK